MAKYKIIPSSRTIVQSPISIGHKAEKGVEAIEFDLTAWVETYGSGTLTVIMRRWGDAIPYPIALEIGEDNKATWTLSDIDTAKAGMAYAQLNYIVGETVVKKSDIYTFRVMDSLTGEGEPPEAYDSWLEHLTHLAAEAMAEVLDIESIVTDKTLTVDGGIADAKATGDALAEKVDAADYSTLSARVGANTIALAEKADRSTTYTKTEVDALIDEVEVETDTTLEIAGAPADAKKVGDELSALKADLGDTTDEINFNLVKAIGTQYVDVDLTQETIILDINVSSSKFVSSTNGRAVVAKIRGGQTITVTKLISSRFKLATSVEYPAVGVAFTNYVMFDSSQQSLKELTITSGQDDRYIFIYFYLNGDSSSVEADVKASIKVFYGTSITTSSLLTEAKDYTNNTAQRLNVTDTVVNVMHLMQAVNLSETNTNIFEDETVINSVVNSNGVIASASTTKSCYIPIKPNAIVTVKAPTLKANRFVVSTTAIIPANGVQTITHVTPPSNSKIYTFVTPSDANYLLITYFNSSGSYTEEEIRAEIEVFYGTVSGTVRTDRLHNPNISSMLMLNDQMLNLLAYRPLGNLKKGYVCLSSDDGRYPLATYVLPTLEAYATQYGKRIPLTMGLADVSPAFDVIGDAEYLATVIEALDDYNCSIGIHGLTMFSGYTREALYNYFVDQNAKLYAKTGHYPTSILYVSHGVNTQVKAIAGSFYGVCGTIPTAAGTDASQFGNTNRANLYNLKRFSLLNVDLTLQNLKDAVDYALDNNEILCPYWHDINFEESSSGVISGQDAKDRFEAFIEYCMSKNVDFINFGDIPTLEINT